MITWDYATTAATNGPIVHGAPSWWWLGITSDSSTRALWQSYQQRHLGQVEGMGKGVRILPIQYLRYLKGSLTCSKFLRHGTSSFTSHPKEGVLRIFIALQNPSPRLGLNPQPLGPVASTLTTTPLRQSGLLWGYIALYPRRLSSSPIYIGQSCIIPYYLCSALFPKTYVTLVDIHPCTLYTPKLNS
jgi:hypothetical protein